ncbi:hypothetical protein LZ480_05505 [Solibacillus sp. MA9]|uniref:Uncharacterized protein n=1 Tax=Solibacillus palustris TaxID=2908203 RepID=A0ABS9UAW2_9BACL|nr:hypothetical protein [Solibacillus sp. MA9]MCH7321343.1 hypothetical protein [Solibacillus sp. MA9]
MRIHHSGNKSTHFFIAYMQLLIQAEIVEIETLKNYMVNQFFNGNIDSLGPISKANFMQALNELQLPKL